MPAIPDQIPPGMFLSALFHHMQEERVAEAVDTIYEYLLSEYEDAKGVDDMPKWFHDMLDELEFCSVRLSEKVRPEEDE